MGLKEKLKNFPKLLFLSAALSLPFYGCTSVGEWYDVSKSYQPTGISSSTNRFNRNETTKEKTFHIAKPSLYDNIMHISVKESLKQVNSQLYDIGTESRYKEIVTQQRKTEDSTPNIFFGTGIGIPLMGLSAIGIAISKNRPEEEMSNDERMGNGLIGIGSVLTGLFGLWILYQGFFSKPVTTIESREINNGRDITKITNRETKRITLGETQIYNDQPAKNIKLIISHNSKTGYIKTNNQGFTNLNLKGTLNYFGISDLNLSETSLENSLERNTLFNQIRPKAREAIKQNLEFMISETDLNFRIETNEQSTSAEKINNDSRTFVIPTYSIPNDTIYRAVKQFVKEKINTRIKDVTFYVKDELTHIPLNDSTFTLNSDAPSKFSLADRYFTQSLKIYAEQNILNYVRGYKKRHTSQNSISFKIYTPSRLSVEVTHPNYDFVSDKLFITNDTPKTVYMVEQGSKIRVQSANREQGRIQ